jgi:hypothetical protein
MAADELQVAVEAHTVQGADERAEAPREVLAYVPGVLLEPLLLDDLEHSQAYLARDGTATDGREDVGAPRELLGHGAFGATWGSSVAPGRLRASGEAVRGRLSAPSGI